MAESYSTSSASSRTASFILRILAFVLSLVSLIVLATNTVIVTDYDDNEAKFRFQDFYAYRYMFATIVIGTAYSIIQLVATICKAISGGGEGMIVLSFYGDKFISYVMATGAAAGFGVTVDLKRITEALYEMSKFYEKAYASASLLLLAFICTALLSIISAFALPKRSL